MAGGSIGRDASVGTIAGLAADAGADTVVVIDLARVGTAAGIDLELMGRLRAQLPGVTLIAGGGIRGWTDLQRLADTGCDGALVATALLTGDLTAADVARAHARG
jgi:phosphoribosylformimino-5-aminoimidazole carboxamide ribotide isomerase